MRIWVALGLASAWTFTAHAADKPIIGDPVPEWVKPAAPAPLSAQADEAAIRLLQLDEQISLEAGRMTLYAFSAFRIQTPQGLSAGNIALSWRPDTDTLTVHKLLIRRGDQVIDVLSSGQTFTIARREANLESAMLDGVLTASLQPEGLQVGDIVELATTVTSSDPTLQGHVEHIGGGMWNVLPVQHARFRMQWPSALPVRLRPIGTLPPLNPVKAGGTTSIELSFDNIEPVILPKGAPPRFQIGRLIEATDFSSWADLGALLAPLYTKAATLPSEGPLLAELARIRELSPDPRLRAEAALALVQDRVRYVFLGMNDGGLVPADAETTWSRRFGDCKGKTALLLALLHALDIEAEPVAVNTVAGDGLDERLPMVGLFNHVLVRATIGGRTYWLDGTRTGDKSLDRIKVPAFGWGLPLRPSGAALVRMMPPPLEEPANAVDVRIDATAGLTVPAPARVEAVIRGDDALATNLALSNLTADARDRALREYWKKRYDFIEIKSVSATFDPERGEQRLAMEGIATMDWSGGRYETDGTSLGYKADFTRHPGPNADAPFAVAHPFYTRNTETILLPPGFEGKRTGNSSTVDQTIAGVEYRRQATLTGNVFKVEASERSVAPEFPASDAPAAQAALRTLRDDGVFLQIPPSYRPTAAERAQSADDGLSTSPTLGFLELAEQLMYENKPAEALPMIERALEIDPKNASALALRAMIHLQRDELAAAKRDIEASAALEPRNNIMFGARGMLAEKAGNWTEAAAIYGEVLKDFPSHVSALVRRAAAFRELGNREGALADAAAAIEQDPKRVDMYLLHANEFKKAGQIHESLAEAAAVTAANPENAFAHVTAARIYAAFNRREEAMSEFNRALAIKPEAYIYINRSDVREKADLAGRRADIEAALKLQPDVPHWLTWKGRLAFDSGDYAAALEIFSKALASSPEDANVFLRRGMAHARLGNATEAEKDFAVARTRAAKNALLLNSMCWAKATAEIALESALADCNAALAITPDAPYRLGSRAFVLLGLGRLDQALADYDKALAKNPNLAASLFGRAVVWARKGNKEKSDADLAAALKIDPNVRDEYAEYGISL